MIFFWLDASAGVKRYVVEEGTSLVNHLFAHVPLDDMFCLLEGVGEIISVIVRNKNRGEITTRAFNQAKRLLDDEIIYRAEVELVLPTENQITASWEFIEKHSLNSTDAILLQCALDASIELKTSGDDLILVSSDKRLLSASRGEGLVTFDPETDNQTTLDFFINSS